MKTNKNVKIFIISVLELKCKNFIERYVDTLESEVTEESSKYLAKSLVEKHPDKFKDVINPLAFAEQTIWIMFLLKGKRKAKNKKMASIKARRSK